MRPDRSLPSRAEQRRLILKSDAYLCGEEFTTSSVTGVLGLHAVSVTNLLLHMARDGLLKQRKVHNNGKGQVFFSKPPTNLARRPWRTHTDEQLGIVEEQERAPVAPRQAAAPAPAKPPSDTLTTQEIANLCRAHFKTFGGLEAAAAHYGLTDGRLSQIQTGLDVSSPRVLKALGIVRERSGLFRRVESCNQNASAPN